MAGCTGCWYDDKEMHPYFQGPSLAAVGTVACLYAGVCCTLSYYLGMTGIFLVFLQILLALLMTSDHSNRGHPSWNWLLMLVGIAAVAGTMVGVANYHTFYAPYLSVKSGRLYENVPPTAKASAHLDGGIIGFNNASLLDTSRAVGMVGHGHTYCVAPILAVDTATSSLHPATAPTVQFWAVGVNCCGERGDFQCDSAGDASAYGGIVVREAEELSTTLLFMSHTTVDEYLRAIEIASALHEIRTADPPVLVRWEKDPKAVMDSWLGASIGIVIASSLVVLLLSAAIWWPIQRYYESRIQAAFLSQQRKVQARASVTSGHGVSGTGSARPARPSRDPFLVERGV